MTDRILVKVTAEKHCILFRTVTSTEKSPHNFFIVRDTIRKLKDKGEITEHDCGSFAILRRDDTADLLSIHFTWLTGSGQRITGREETVTLSYERLLDFMERSSQADGPKEWSALSIESDRGPKLEFCAKKKLHAALENKTVRRKLVKFLRDNFRWKSASKICFYDDFVPYSFTFREFRNGQPGTCGGLILHGQENLDRAYYSIHT